MWQNLDTFETIEYKFHVHHQYADLSACSFVCFESAPVQI